MILDGDIYDIGQTVNGVSRFLYLDNKWYYARSLVMRYNYDESDFVQLFSGACISLSSVSCQDETVTADVDVSVKLIGNIFTNDELISGLDFSESPEILGEIREMKLKELGI